MADRTKLHAKFPPFITTKQLYAHFSHCGFDESEVQIQRHTNHSTGKPSGSATIFVTQADDFISIVNDTLLLQKHRLKVTLYQRRQKKRQNRRSLLKEKPVMDQYASNTEAVLSNVTPEMINSPSSSPSTYSCRIFVGSGLPAYINEQHIREHFKQFQKSILRVDTIRDRETKVPKGYFFITFQSQAFADMAVQTFNHSLLLGEHKIKVENEKPRLSTAVKENVVVNSPSYGARMTPSSTPCLIVDNLDAAISDDDIKAYISVPVVEMNATKVQSQRCLIFHSDHDASIARNMLDGKNFLGKVIRVIVPERGYLLNTPSTPHGGSGPQHSLPVHHGFDSPMATIPHSGHRQPGVRQLSSGMEYQSQFHIQGFSPKSPSNETFQDDSSPLTTYPGTQRR